MAWIDDLQGKHILQDGVPFPDRKNVNFVASPAVVISDNPATGSTDITVTSDGGASVDSGSGTVALTAADSGKTLVNSTVVQWNLPAASDGLAFEVINMVSGGTTLKAHGTDLIEFFNSASSAGGTQNTTDIFASVKIRAVGNKWICIGVPTGVWAAA